MAGPVYSVEVWGGEKEGFWTAVKYEAWDDAWAYLQDHKRQMPNCPARIVLSMPIAEYHGKS